MRTTGRVVVGTAAAMLLAACASSRGAAGGDGPGDRSRSTVLTESELLAANEPLLKLLQQRLPGLQVRETQGCPEVLLRGRSTVSTSSSPAIYVDGTRATNSCILSELGTSGLGLVEIYQSGIPSRPGYTTHPYGVILIFMRGPSSPVPPGQ